MAAGYDDGVGVCQLRQAVFRADSDRSRGDDGFATTHAYSVARFAGGQPGVAESLQRDGQIERDHVRFGQDGN